MKVILQREVDKLGVPGDVVIVADGFARNYLIPRGLAAPAAKGAVRHADRLKRTHEERVRRDVEEARAIAERLSKSPLRMPARAGEEGRLFGSITVSDVADAVEEVLGAPIDRKRLQLAEPIRSVGTHEAVLHLHPEVTATVTIEVVSR
jgi:large subunit ribosomal protein L9